MSDFTTDAIIFRLLGELGTSNDTAAKEENIRLFEHPDVSAYIELYLKDGVTRLRCEVGYIYAPPTRTKLDFTKFIALRSLNPMWLSAYKNIYFNTMTVNDADDEHHRYGCDIDLFSWGLENAAICIDYMLVANYP